MEETYHDFPDESPNYSKIVLEKIGEISNGRLLDYFVFESDLASQTVKPVIRFEGEREFITLDIVIPYQIKTRPMK